jgi:hypothetical protein
VESLRRYMRHMTCAKLRRALDFDARTEAALAKPIGTVVYFDLDDTDEPFEGRSFGHGYSDDSAEVNGTEGER